MRDIVKKAVREAELYTADMFNFHSSAEFKPDPKEECCENKEVFVCKLKDCRYIPARIFKNATLYLVIHIEDTYCTAELYLRLDNDIYQFGDDGSIYNSGQGLLKLYSFDIKVV
jgi:hypothetical protein